MPSRLLPGGLRGQLAVAIALITALALGLSFLAVYHGTASDLRNRIDEDLRTQAAEWEQLRARRDLSTPRRVEASARAFIAAQGYHPASRIFVVDVANGSPVSNQAEVLEHEIEREEGEREENGAASSGRGVVSAATGLTTAQSRKRAGCGSLPVRSTTRADASAPCRSPIRSAASTMPSAAC